MIVLLWVALSFVVFFCNHGEPERLAHDNTILKGAGEHNILKYC